MSSDAARVERQISIQSGVVNRLTKEVGYYQKESASEQATLEKWEQGGFDEPKLRQQRTVVAQARAMVPDTAQRLDAAVANLKTLLVSAPFLATIISLQNNPLTSLFFGTGQRSFRPSSRQE